MLNRWQSYGFTLVEMAVSLVILGVVVGGATTMLGRSASHSSDAFAGNFAVNSFDQAIMGFFRANHRLPCPDVTEDGIEDCTFDGSAVAVGVLPLSTLQLSLPPREKWRLPIAYGIYRGKSADSDLGVSSAARYTSIPDSHSAFCPPGTADSDCDLDDPGLDSTTTLVTTDNITLNVLDSCSAITRARIESSTVDKTLLHTGTSSADVAAANIAYALTWSTTPALFSGTTILESRQGLDNSLRFYPPGPSPENSDDLTLGKTFNSLAQAMDCAERSGDAGLTLQSTSTLMTSEYLNRVRLAHLNMIKADRESAVSDAEREVVFATIDTLLSAASLALAIAEGTEGNPVAIANVALTAIEVANAAAGVGLAADSLIEAEDDLEYLNTNILPLARTRLNDAGDGMTEARSIALVVQERGRL